MSKHGIKIVFVMIALIISLSSGCVKDVTVTISNNVAVTKKVSFSKDIQPLFTANCATSGCHNANHQLPDLEKGDAYNSIKALNLIDITTPANSILYGKMTGKLIPAMPLGAPSNPSNINNLVLAWIQQGALNN
jgi:hypothetical protein